MTAESQPIEGAAKRPGLRHGVLVSRRRLAKAGLASPVVLGSLMSKPVLGADPLYHCTPSGQQSGNLSRTSTVSCKIGISPAAWAIDSAWPSPVTKGTDPNNNGNSGCAFNGQAVRGTAFDGFSGLAATFGLSADGCTVVTSAYSTSATMLQVLKTTDPAFGLGRETIAAILNALRYGSGFPVTPSRVIAMYNAVRSGGTYLVNSVPWSASQVQTYFTSLHG
jgi:hypothetical protein